MSKIPLAGRSSLFALLWPLALAGCVASPPAPSSDPPAVSAGEERTVAGTVAALDLDPMSYDADGVVTVAAEGGAAFRVFIPARRHLCRADLDGFDGVEVGQAVEVRGAAVGPDGVRPCERAEHYFRSR